MRFDEALDILVKYCARVSPSLAAAKGRGANNARNSTYGNDIWIPQIAQSHWGQRGISYGDLQPEHCLPFYDATWELCRIGVLRPGCFAPMGQGQHGGALFDYWALDA